MAADPNFSLTIKPNCSLGDKEFACLLLPVLTIPAIAGLVFAAMGAWMVLPFAGIEASLIAVAVIGNYRRKSSVERIVLSGGRLRVEVDDWRGTGSFESNAAWVRLVESERGMDYRLLLCAHGREIEVGRHMDFEGRRRFAATLRRKLNGSA